MQNNADQGTMNLHSQAAVVRDEAQIPEAVEEEADPGAGGSDHFGQGFLAHLGDHWDGFRFLTEVGHQQKEAGKPLLAGVEKVIDQVRLHANVAGEEMREKLLGKVRFATEQAQHDSLLHSHNGAMLQRRGCGHAYRLPGKATFAEEMIVGQNSNDGFFAAL